MCRTGTWTDHFKMIVFKNQFCVRSGFIPGVCSWPSRWSCSHASMC
uniref:Uncharacterized protein n=1 Tax=Anguilla anguilla TaxID=7936 RepID=A0A0E9U389_ANGAN